MIRKIVQVLFVLLAALFIYVGFTYHDAFYYFLSLTISIFIVSLSFSHKLSDKRIALPKLSLDFKRLEKLHIRYKLHHRVEHNKSGKKIWGFSYIEFFAITLFSIFFTFITVYKLQPEPNITNVVFNFYSSQFNWILRERVYLGLLVSIFIIFIFILRDHRKKRKATLNILLKSTIRVFLSLLLGFNLALLLTFILAISEANLIAVRAKLRSSSTGIVSGQTSVLNRIKNMDKPPQITGSEHGLKKTILALDAKKAGLGLFYIQQVIPKLPESTLVLLKFPNEALVMFDDYLFISEIKKGEIEAISPIIGKLFVKQQFDPRYIKDEPSVSVLSRQEYLEYRDKQINKKLQEIDDVLVQTQKSINILYGNISTDKQQIEANKSAIGTAASNRDAAVNNCRTACYYSYYFNHCYRYYSDSECNDLQNKWNQVISQYETNISEWEAALRNDQIQLNDYLGYKKYFEDVKTLVETQKDSVPYELGVFEPKNTIKVVLESTSNTAVADYFATLVHEYLHYTSYVSDERTLPQFFEEGLTEYFARRIVKDELKTSINLGYPHLVRVIQEMIRKIPEKELEQIYFTKDKKSLIALLNETYGSNFYKDSEYYFWAMSLVSLKDALKFTNNIMFRIGGPELIEQDILSTYSGEN